MDAIYTNINGNLLADSDMLREVPLAWELRFGVGVFETILVTDGEIKKLDSHLSRLSLGMAALGFAVSGRPDKLTVEREIMKVVLINELQSLCKVRIQFFQSKADFKEFKSQRVNFIIECFKVGDEIKCFNKTGLSIGICSSVCKAIDQYSALKTTSRFQYFIASKEAMNKGWDDALILNPDGEVIESCISNIFIVKSGKVYTPAVNSGCIAGVMRNRLLTESHWIVQRPISYSDIVTADEVFLTNAISSIRWVEKFENIVYTNNFTKEHFQYVFEY